MAKMRKTKTKYAGVFRLENGGWWIQATQRDAEGRRKARRRALPSELSIDEAARARAALVAELAAELAEDEAPAVEVRPSAAHRRGPKAATTTVADYVLSWAATKRSLLKPSTREHYADVLGRFVVPVIGSLRVDELTRADVVGWIGWAQQQKNRFDRPYAQATLRSWYRVLATMLRDMAAEFGLPDPTTRVSPPKSKVRNVREGVTLTPEQIGALLDAVKRDYPQWHAEVYMLFFSGLRVGELYALKWEDLDPARGVINVCRAVWRGHVELTKTDNPREVALTDRIREVLDDHRMRLVREQHPGLAAGLVFPADTGGHRHGSSLQKILRLSGKAAGIPTRCGPQVIRRTVNTTLVEDGVAGPVVRAQMGHTSEKMTTLYAGIHPEAKLDAVNRMHALVEAASAAGDTSGNTSGNTSPSAGTGSGGSK